MAEKEIVAQINKLRTTRPERVLDAMGGAYSAVAGMVLTATMLRDDLTNALTFLRDDLKVEARLVGEAKIKGGTTIQRDRLAVAGWLELFILQLSRIEESAAPAPVEVLSPSAELTEHRPSQFGTEAATQPGPGGRCAVGNVHDEHTLKCACGYPTRGADALKPSELSGDQLLTLLDPMSPAMVTRANTGEIEAFLAADLPGAAPDARERIDALPAGALPAGTLQFPTGEADALLDSFSALRGGIQFPAQVSAVVERIGTALIGEQAAHAAIDKEYAHVTADPFAPIPRAVWAPTAPPGARKLSSVDLLTPVDPTSLPAHLSFSQVTTVADCGAKYRMQRVDKVPQVPQWANIGGKAFHACVEWIELNKETADVDSKGVWALVLEHEIIDAENASGMVRQQFRPSNKGKEGYDWWRVEGALMLQRYVDWRNQVEEDTLLTGPDGRSMLEWETTYDVEGVPFKTILDSVWTLRGDHPVVRDRTAIIKDWKTGSLTPDDRQLCTQAWGLRKAGWQGPILVQFFDARKGVMSEPFDPFERMNWDDVRYFVLGGDADRRRPILSARPSDFCGGCPVAYACPIMGQRKAPKATR